MFGTISFAEPTLHSIVICVSWVRLVLLPGPQMACDLGLTSLSSPRLLHNKGHRGGLYQVTPSSPGLSQSYQERCALLWTQVSWTRKT